MINEPVFADIQSAYERIKSKIHHTPVMTSLTFDGMMGAKLFFKCENLQKTGSFKIRGALNAVLSLSEEAAVNGVATHSSGNHAGALAYAAKLRVIKCYVVMPENTPQVKQAAVAGYGGEIVLCKPTLKSREETAAEIVAKTNADFVHPYNDFRIICGQGTIAIEMLQQQPDLDIIVVPVSGGGMISGISIAAAGISPKTEVIAAEPKNADDVFKSLQVKRVIPPENPNTIADGLRGCLGSLTSQIVFKNVKRCVTASEESIISTMKLMWERMKIVVEPSSAVPLAAIFENKEIFAGKKVGVVISGGNADLDNIPWIK